MSVSIEPPAPAGNLDPPATSAAARQPLADRSPWLVSICLALMLVTVIVIYWPARNGPAIEDDGLNLTKPELQSLHGLYRIWFDPIATADSQYYPLTHTAFWIEHKLWGDSTLGYHLANVLWHSLSVVLVYLIVSRLKIPGALLAAAIYAVHPVMVESVAWMCEQKNTFSTVLYLSTMLVYLEFDELRKRSLYLISIALFALALLAKTSTVTLPVALLVIFWWKRGALSWRRDVLLLVPFFALAVASGLITMTFERKYFSAESSDFALTPVERFLIAGRVVWFYVGKLVWPDVSFTYARWNIDSAQWWQWLFPIAALALTFALWAFRKRSRAPLAAWLLFCGTLFPVLGFVNVFMFTITFVADHMQYLAALGLIVLAAAAIARFLAHLNQNARIAGYALCVLSLGALAVVSSMHSSLFGDVFALYKKTLARNPDCWLPHANYGLVLAKSGDLSGAIEHYRMALHVKPDNRGALNNMGLALMQRGQPAEAIKYFEHALEVRPDFILGHNNIASALIQLGRYSEAVDHYREAVRLKPDYPEAHQNLGVALMYAGRLPESIEELRAALELNPDNPTALNTLGAVYLQFGQYPDAISNLQRAISLKPDYPEAHNNLGQALIRVGQVPQAIEEFRTGIQVDEHFAPARISLGLVLLAQNKFAESIPHFEQAIRSGANQPDVQNNLGDAYRKSGQKQTAIDHYREATRLKPDFMLAYANLAQTLAAVDRSQEAIATAEKAIQVARSTGQQPELEQFENWLNHYRVELQRATDAASHAPTSSAKP